jgi:hypothetical protein
VFLDPDNEIREEVSRRPAAEYAFVDELDPFIHRGQTLVVYQHQTRARDMRTQTRVWLRRFGQRWHTSSACAIVFRLRLVRAYFVLPAERHRRVLQERVQHVRERWGSLRGVCGR